VVLSLSIVTSSFTVGGSMFVCNIRVKKNIYVTRIKVLNAMKSPFFWIVTLYSLEKKNLPFWRNMPQPLLGLSTEDRGSTFF
jgi:hypothetical protein